MKQNIKTIISPFVIILIGFTVSFTFNKLIGAWAFIPLAVAYWGAIFCMAKPDKNKIKEAFKGGGQFGKFNMIAYIPCFFCIIVFVCGLRYIKISFAYIALMILFVSINPFAEELFWRQYLLDNLTWKKWQKIIFSVILFLLSHPLMWGIFSVTVRSVKMIAPLFIFGIIWSIVYIKTKTLRHCIIAHAIVDVLVLSVWVLLNIYVPSVSFI
jgi:membrane protease YdiL (CAAX protease family)